MMQEAWFKTWFDANYYHILYKNRDYQEARQFIDALLGYLKPAEKSHFLDVACGKGRHSIYLNQRGFEVTGVDLSVNSISIASENASDSLHFMVQDIREDFGLKNIDYALNLFTSFGYFDTDEEHIQALKNVFNTLKSNGTFVINYLNVAHVAKHLIQEEVQEREGITFKINRAITDGFIIKSIKVIDGEKEFDFEEKVKAIDAQSLTQMLEKAGFSIKTYFGDYHLNEFSDDRPRVIIIAQKNS